MKRDLVSISDLEPDQLSAIFSLAQRLKRERRAGQAHPLLSGKTLAMLFEKPSLRTRVTFEAGMVQLGGYAVYLSPADIGLGTRESPTDVARNLSRWVDLIMVRTFAHQTVLELAEQATVPVINGLSDLSHPCQILADCLTLIEQRGRLDGLRIAFVGDGNNVVNSWLNVAAKLPISFRLACPPGYEPDAALLAAAQKAGGDIRISHALPDAVDGAPMWSTPTCGPAWARKTRAPPASRPLPPTRSTPRSWRWPRTPRSWRWPSPKPWSCTACPPIAARRSAPRSWTAPNPSCWSRPRTACTCKKRSWSGCSSSPRSVVLPVAAW